MRKYHSLEFKIIASVVLYILVLGISGNLFLYVYLSRAVSEKAERLDRAYLEAVRQQLDRNFGELFSLAVLCANDPAVIRAVSRSGNGSGALMRDALNAHERLNVFISASPVGSYVDRLILFDTGMSAITAGTLFVQATGRRSGESGGKDSIKGLPLYAEFAGTGANWVGGFGPSMSIYPVRDCYAFMFRIPGSYSNKAEGILYLEAGLDMITDIFSDYHIPDVLSAVIPNTEQVLLRDSSVFLPLEEAGPAIAGAFKSDAGAEIFGSIKFRQGKRTYRIDSLPLSNADLILYHQADITTVTPDDRRILYTVLLVVLTSLLAAAGLGLILSIYLTRPIQRIISRIEKITANDFSFDPAIERSRDEIGRIGSTVNKMSGSIKRLLDAMEANYKKLKDTELALRQTQINPHFLYNTLDSIQWMARIQRTPGIADFTRSLIGLLRRIAAVSGSVITLRDELQILDDYIAIMAVRFMGTFEVVNKIPERFFTCLIPKFTLQPLVENAIIHGIDPSGHFGIITFDAHEARNFIVITVEDTGVGMDTADLETVMQRGSERNGASLNNIGLRNVDERLKLRYGSAARLKIESVKGEFTRAAVYIPMDATRMTASVDVGA